MKLLLAPLHGHTDFVFRNVLFKNFSGIDACYSPFITTVRGKTVRESHIRDVLPRYNKAGCLIPQIIGKDPEEFIVLANQLFSLGYETINWNLGCPYPMVVNKRRGAGLLPHADLISRFLETVVPNITCKIEIKMRLGKDDPSEARDVISALNAFPLSSVTIHARTARQMYSGSVDLDSFAECLTLSRHPVVYNGDITDVASFRRISERFNKINSFMIGRGLLMDPSLAERIKSLTNCSKKTYGERLYRFHEDIVLGYQSIGYAGQMLLGRLKQFWCFFSFSFERPEERLRKIQRVKMMKEYWAEVEEAFEKS
jgi:tRNA-dihydrouridine synthase B